jgi:predicted amidophosphoribosyltransferase
MELDDGVFTGKRVLLVDDLYQSGISMNYCALLLLRAGAKKVFGLACEKTCRNDDNVAGRK